MIYSLSQGNCKRKRLVSAVENPDGLNNHMGVAR